MSIVEVGQKRLDRIRLRSDRNGDGVLLSEIAKIYRPLETRLLREARDSGCRTQDGLDMLVHQAVEQIRIWSGKQADASELRGAALAELER